MYIDISKDRDLTLTKQIYKGLSDKILTFKNYRRRSIRTTDIRRLYLYEKRCWNLCVPWRKLCC